MPKLHELLAVKEDLRKQAETCRADLMATFEKKPHHFSKKIITITTDAENVPDEIKEQLDMQTTVGRELKWIAEKLASSIDVFHQIELANTEARGDLILDTGAILLPRLPATSLLNLEHRVEEIRQLIHSIRTLDPAKGFREDESQGKGVYRAREEVRIRTDKVFSYQVMVPPTEKHPAQVKELMLDKRVGTNVAQEWSSLLTVGQKGDMLDRVEALLRAVRAARSRSNEHEINAQQNKIGETLLNYIFGDALDSGAPPKEGNA